MKKYGIFIAYTLAIILLAGAAASGLTVLFMSGSRVQKGDDVRVSQEDYAKLQSYRRLDELMSIIKKQFILQEVDDALLLEGAAKGMFAVLGDPYSYYLNAQETAALKQSEQGVYPGIGCEMMVDPKTSLSTIVRVYKDSPAEAGGMLVGDMIVRVDDTDVIGMDSREIVALIKATPEDVGTQVSVMVLRDGEYVDVSMTRAIITVNRIDVRMLDNEVGLINIYSFEGENTVKDFKAALEELKKQNAKGMIIDLRNNPGGDLNVVCGISDLLLPKGPIVSIEYKDGRREEYESDPSAFTLPMAVLVNGMSASASEILAACVQDYDLGRIVGTQTFGKGIVQGHYVFKDEELLSLTTGRYYTPAGHYIHEVGVTPDIQIELPEELMKNPLLLTRENDLQLQAALENVHGVIDAQAD